MFTCGNPDLNIKKISLPAAERLRQAAAAIKAGDQAQAYALLQPILDTEQAQALLRQLHG